MTPQPSFAVGPQPAATERPVVTVVIVDDTLANRWVLSRVLEEAGYAVVQGETGADAMRLMGTHPDLLVLDVRLPDIDGYEIARRLKHDPATASIPILLISASFTSPTARAQGLDSGADSYLTHPVEPPVLVATVRALLRGRHAEQALEGMLARERVARTEADALRAEADEARRTAEEANVAKATFLAAMSHELRTPLNAIGGYVDLLELGVRGPITDAQREDLERIRKNQRHLLGLINNILNFAKIEAGHVEYAIEEVPVAPLLAGLETLIGPQLVTRRLSFRAIPPAEGLAVRADADKVQQVMLNLLSNAVKFTASGGEVVVEAERREDVVAIRVRDTGRGIPPDKIEAIFEPFVQVDQHFTREGHGTGLGLSISRDLARAMGGDLTAESVLEAGATFTLTLPAA